MIRTHNNAKHHACHAAIFFRDNNINKKTLNIIQARSVGTENPASALKRPELGTFRQGGVGDASVLALDTGKFDYVDAVGEHLEGNMGLHARGLVIGGDWLDSP